MAPADSRPDPFVQFVDWVFGVGHERNVGGVERTVRYLVGALCLVLAAVLLVVPETTGVWNSALVLLLIGSGFYLIYEARVQYCPLNESFGRSTYRK